VLAFVAIAVRALVPGGYMLGPSDDGRTLAIVLCSGHEAFIDLRTGQLVDAAPPSRNQDNSDQRGDAPCVFAVSAEFATPTHALASPPTFTASQEAPTFLPMVTPRRGLAAPPPWATGPPLTL
jgi:hypothetical protein